MSGEDEFDAVYNNADGELERRETSGRQRRGNKTQHVSISLDMPLFPNRRILSPALFRLVFCSPDTPTFQRARH